MRTTSLLIFIAVVTWFSLHLGYRTHDQRSHIHVPGEFSTTSSLRYGEGLDNNRLIRHYPLISNSQRLLDGSKLVLDEIKTGALRLTDRLISALPPNGETGAIQASKHRVKTNAGRIEHQAKQLMVTVQPVANALWHSAQTGWAQLTEPEQPKLGSGASE